MATASPTPMGSSHFGSLSRRPSSRQTYRPTRPQLHRSDSVPAVTQAQARDYSLNDSSDDEIVIPMMKFSAETNALLNDAALAVETSSLSLKRSESHKEEPYKFKGVNTGDGTSPPGTRVHSPFPRRVVRLSGTPGSSTLRRRSSTLSSAVRKHNEIQAAPKADNALDLSTPAPVPRTVRIPITHSGSQGRSGGSSGNASSKADSASRTDEGEPGSQGYPATVLRSQLGTSQGSVSRYGVGRTRYGEEAGLASSMRTKPKIKGSFLSGPARRGRIRKNDEEQSPLEEQGDSLDAAGSIQERQSQESQAPESQSQNPASSQESEANVADIYASSSYRDFASGSPVSNKEAINSILRSKSPPPPTLASSQRSSVSLNPRAPLQPIQPVFKVPAPRPDLPSAHDQENEAPPTFKRNKQAPLIHLDKMEKVPVRPESMDMSGLRSAGSPERRALAPRSQNTPRRPAPPPPKMSILDAATSTAGAATTSNASGKRNRLKVNGKYYTRLDCIGRGGSSRVYRVMAENSRFCALKRVTFDDGIDDVTRAGFFGEIELLERLKGSDRVIRIYDHELNEEKGILSVLMEMGELDMKKILDMRLGIEHAKFDSSFVRHYWKEMLLCLRDIHAHSVVHSDLKPHNFVLVQGRLKLIDFGIANAIQTDETVNVHRETQIGTPNYMSPESLLDSNAKPDARGRINGNAPKLMKLGKPSDIWSLGCILYQMTYGRPPFDHIQNQMQRCQAIITPTYAIEYPSLGVGKVPVPSSLIKTLKKCLDRDQFKRPSAEELLSDTDPFLNPVEYDDLALPMTEDLLGRILLNVVNKIKEKPATEHELLKAWPQGYFERLRQNMKEGKAL